jgi:hypothetical protein
VSHPAPMVATRALAQDEVTSLTFRTHRAPSATSFHLTWSHTGAAGAIAAWQACAPAAPDELCASLLLSAGGDPKQPPMVDLFGSMLGGEHDTAKLIAGRCRQIRIFQAATTN